MQVTNLEQCNLVLKQIKSIKNKEVINYLSGEYASNPQFREWINLLENHCKAILALQPAFDLFNKHVTEINKALPISELTSEIVLKHLNELEQLCAEITTSQVNLKYQPNFINFFGQIGDDCTSMKRILSGEIANYQALTHEIIKFNQFPSQDQVNIINALAQNFNRKEVYEQINQYEDGRIKLPFKEYYSINPEFEKASIEKLTNYVEDFTIPSRKVSANTIQLNK